MKSCLILLRASHDGVSVKCWVSFFSLFLLSRGSATIPAFSHLGPWVNRLSRAVD
jgi:hypothetical protein